MSLFRPNGPLSDSRAEKLRAEADQARFLAAQFPASETAQSLLEFACACDDLALEAEVLDARVSAPL